MMSKSAQPNMLDEDTQLGDAIDEQAALWFTRQHSNHLNAEQNQEFSQWLKQPQHQRAYQAILDTWHGCRSVPRPELLPSSKRTPRTWFNWRYNALAFCFLLLALLPFSYLLFPTGDSMTLTTHDEMLELTLEDGSSVFLNKNTQLRVTYSDAERRLWLDQGQVYFKVAPNTARPFYVLAEDVQVKVVGTEFDVSRSAQHQVDVAVHQGIVEVQSDNDSPTYLHAGAQAVKEKSNLPLKVSQTKADYVGSWRHGQLHFFDTPLQEVLVKLNPYLTQDIQLATPDLGQLSVSGVANLNDAAAFIDAMPLILPVTLVAKDEKHLLISNP